jgi:hypothetical protein
VLFLIAAAADPVYQTDEPQQKTVIVFDNSAIMNVKNNSNRTLFDEAREKLINLIDSTTSNHQIAIICTADSNQFNNTSAAILTGFTENKKELKQKITSIRNTNIPSNLTNSIDLATKFIELDDFTYNNSTGLNNTDSNILHDSRIVVFTANENLNWYADKKAAYFSKPKIEFYLPEQAADQKSYAEVVLNSEKLNTQSQQRGAIVQGRNLPPIPASVYKNVAITRFQPRLFFDDLSRYELFVELCNFGDAVIETKLRIFVDGRLFDVISVLLNSRETRSYFINGEITAASNIGTKNFDNGVGLIIRGEIEIQDSFAADNIAYTILPPPMLQKILYYGDYNFFLVNALKSCMLSSRQPATFERVMEIPDVVPTNSVLVINRNVPPILPAGNVMIFDPRNGCDLFEVGELLPSPSLVEVESSDSLLTKFLQFQSKKLLNVRKLHLHESQDNNTPEILLTTVEHHPIYLSWNFRNKNKHAEINQTTYSDSDFISSRILVFVPDISRGDLVLQTTFPILVGNALSYFRGTSNEFERNYSVGERVILTTNILSDCVKIKSPSGETKILPVHNNSNSSTRTVYIGKLSEIGVYEIFEINKSNSDHLIKRLACNFDHGKKNTIDDSQIDAENLKKFVEPIQADGKYQFFNFNNLQFYFLLTVCALILMICNWRVY